MPIATNARSRRIFGVAAVLALGLIGLAAIMQWREANDVEVVQVALNPKDLSQDRVGALIYRGGLDIPRMGKNIGGLSALRWDEPSGRLLALTDDARYVWITPREEAGRLIGIESLDVGDLVGLDGEPLSGKEKGDSESLTRSAKGGWLVGFERDHRIWRYPSLDTRPEPSKRDLQAWLGPLENNSGLETLAGDETDLLVCAERWSGADDELGNCALVDEGGGVENFGLVPQGTLFELGGVPTDADIAVDGTAFVLLRSYSSSDGSGAEILALSPQGERTEVATLRPPLSVDNFEGLALRQEGERTFLYMVSDDNFSANQRTLLMKFEL